MGRASRHLLLAQAPEDAAASSRRSVAASDTTSASTRPRAGWATALSVALFGGVLLALHGGALRFPFLADDYFFYDETRPGSGWSPLEAVALTRNYFRPVGRELYFYVLSRVLGPHPLLFHLFNLAILLVCIGLVFALARRLMGERAAAFAAGAYALRYAHRVLLAWVSCAQDLLAAALGLVAALLYVRGQRRWAALAFFVGLFAKESIAALPLVLALWEVWQLVGVPLGKRLKTAAKRTLPLWVAAAAWAVIVVIVRSTQHAWMVPGEALPVADVVLKPQSLWLGLRLALLTYLYLDQPLSYLAEAARHVAWPALATVLAMAAVLLLRWTPSKSRRTERPTAAGWKLGLVWAVVGALPVALVGHHYSAYYVCFSAVGFALAAGWLLARLPLPATAAVLALCVWADGVANGVQAFRVAREIEEKPGVSYVSIARLEWQRKFVDSLHAALAADPPPRGAVIYLSHAPSYFALATFGSHGPRVWFDDPTLELSYITHYTPGDETRPRRFVSFDDRRWSFVTLSNALVDEIYRGETALAQGKPADAKAALASALSMIGPRPTPERADVENTYGLAAYQTGDSARARQAWLSVLAQDPHHRGALLNLAAVSAGRGDFASARAWTARVLSDAPQDPTALYYMARIERALGHETEARRAWEMLASSQPAFADSLARSGAAP